ncbi:MAG: hypothetical protein HXY35_04520 [Chloroflexi bacterium]|nr:hypothetical protein [Chloroflexota bacterium]
MVHALNEIRRVLVPDGFLIDLRPIVDQWRVEVISARETRETGRVTDLPLGLADDTAANQAMANAEAHGWFLREHEEFFSIHYAWDSASKMEEWIDEEWENFVSLDEETRRATRSAWALANADSQVRVKVKMLITRWRKRT